MNEWYKADDLCLKQGHLGFHSVPFKAWHIHINLYNFHINRTHIRHWTCNETRIHTQTCIALPNLYTHMYAWPDMPLDGHWRWWIIDSYVQYRADKTISHFLCLSLSLSLSHSLDCSISLSTTNKNAYAQHHNTWIHWSILAEIKHTGKSVEKLSLIWIKSKT